LRGEGCTDTGGGRANQTTGRVSCLDTGKEDQPTRHTGADDLSRLTSTPVKPETHGAIESQLNSETTKDQKLNFGVVVANDKSHLRWGAGKELGAKLKGRQGY